jgi:hypothetical protein
MPRGNRKVRARGIAWLALPAALLLAACGGGGVGGGTACVAPADAPPELVAGGADSHLSIVNDDDALAGLVTCMEQDVGVEAKPDPLAAEKGGGWSGGKYGNGRDFKLTLVAEVAPPTVVGAPRFAGLGPDDLEAGGVFTGAFAVTYVVEIDATDAPDTFRWSDDGGATWAAEGVPVSGGAQALNRGVTVTFGATEGHIPGDAWTFDAARLMATSVGMNGNHQVVSYAVAGAPRLGGLLVFQKFTKDPVLRSQALFRDAEIHAVDVSNGVVYGAGAAEPGTFAEPAELERIKLHGSRLVFDGYRRLGLPGFAATGVTRDGPIVYATSGTGGGLTAILDAPFTPDRFVPLEDARWVDEDKGLVAVARGGAAGGTLSLLDGTLPALPALDDLGFDGADVPEAKTTVQVVGGKAYVAAGRAGVQVLSLATGQVLATVPVPDVPGLDPADVTANAVAVEHKLVFISFGGAGVYVAQADRPCTEPDDGTPVVLKVLGRLAFEDFASTNHVAVLDGHLFVASGLGGLKIVRVEQGGKYY